MSAVTRILEEAGRGDAQAASQLLEAVYEELHRLAKARMAREKPGQTLQPTALVHEAYMRLVGDNCDDGSRETRWQNRRHFFAAAAEAMRRILVDRARAKQRIKRGGGLHRVSMSDALCDSLPIDEPDPDAILLLHEALDQLGQEDPTKAEVVRLRYFAGLSIDQTAEILDVSSATVDRYWAYARAWLFDRMDRASQV